MTKRKREKSVEPAPNGPSRTGPTQERMNKWWRDTMRQGGGATADRPSRDTAPNFTARLMTGRSERHVDRVERGVLINMSENYMVDRFGC